MASNISDFSEWYSESEVLNLSLQHQLDESNAKLLEHFNVQNAVVLKLQDQLKKSQAAQDFYCSDKLCKLTWFHLVASVVLFHLTLALLFRLINFINN